MKQIQYILLPALLCFCMANALPAQAQDDAAAQRYEMHKAAFRYLNGFGNDIDYPKAFEIYTQLANQGEAYAANALGGMYRQGFGVTQDFETALEYFETALDLGYDRAAVNLAYLYKNGEGVAQDFEKAFYYFQKACDMGNETGFYGTGYCYLKGFGVEQNYEKAVRYFRAGADAEETSCIYFLGLCYLGGYGVDKDAERGKQLITQASRMGHNHATEFITGEFIDTFSGNPNATAQPYRQVQNNADQALEGIWEGSMRHYDWGKQHVIEEWKLSLQLDYHSGQLSGVWLHNDSVSMHIQGERNDSVFVLSDMYYLQNWDRTWQLQHAALELTTDSAGAMLLTGNIAQYSPEILEPSSPVMIALKRVTPTEEKAEAEEKAETEAEAVMEEKAEAEKVITPNPFILSDSSHIASPPLVEGVGGRLLSFLIVYPNPFSREFTVEINLAQAQTATLQLRTISGRPVYSDTQAYSAGLQRRTLDLSLVDGAYLLSLQGETVNVNTILIKKP